MAIILTDDGTLDTVLRCSKCGEEFRFNYSETDEIVAETETCQEDQDGHYDQFVDSCIEEIEAEHECGAETDGDEDH